MKRSTTSTAGDNGYHHTNEESQTKKFKQSPLSSHVLSLLLMPHSSSSSSIEKNNDLLLVVKEMDTPELQCTNKSLSQLMNHCPRATRLIFEFLSFDELIQSVSLVCKTVCVHVYHSIHKLFLVSDSVRFDSQEHMLSVIKRFPHVQHVIMDGLDVENEQQFELSPNVLQLLMRNAKTFNKHLNEITIQQCNLPSISIVDDNQLQVLRLDHLQLSQGIHLEASRLRVIEFYDCSFVVQNQPIQLQKCFQVEQLLFCKCAHFTDLLLHSFLTSFLSEGIKNRIELARTSRHQSTIIDKSSTVSGDKGGSDDGEDRPSQENFFQTPYKLKKLTLIECEPLTNPIIQSETLEELRLVRCKHLSAPLISCYRLSRLQLNWCDQLQNLTMAAPKLKFLDLTGVGRRDNNENTRNNIISAVKQFSPDIQISY